MVNKKESEHEMEFFFCQLWVGLMCSFLNFTFLVSCYLMTFPIIEAIDQYISITLLGLWI